MEGKDEALVQRCSPYQLAAYSKASFLVDRMVMMKKKRVRVQGAKTLLSPLHPFGLPFAKVLLLTLLAVVSLGLEQLFEEALLLILQVVMELVAQRWMSDSLTGRVKSVLYMKEE